MGAVEFSERRSDPLPPSQISLDCCYSTRRYPYQKSVRPSPGALSSTPETGLRYEQLSFAHHTWAPCPVPFALLSWSSLGRWRSAGQTPVGPVATYPVG